MFGSARIGLKEMAGLCRRLSTALGAGVDVRKVWLREAERAVGPSKRRFQYITDNIKRGGSVTESVEDCGVYFPELFHAMLHVGESSGNLSEVLREMAEQYDHQIKLRRAFVTAIRWPMLQLAMSVGVIGLLIWILGILPPGANGKPIDILGFGLTGTTGLIKYLLIVGGIALAVIFLVRAIMRGALWIRPVQKLVLRLPQLGRAFQTLALAKLAWTMHITIGAGMDLRDALTLSLRSSRNAEYADTADAVWSSIRRGSNLHDAFASTANYPRDFLDTIEVGEQSGRLSESLGNLADQYEDEARSAMETFTKLLGFLVWFLVGAMIVMMIFRLASFYVGILNNAANGKF